MIAGIVLAAGRSERMGRPKALLGAEGRRAGEGRERGETFLERAVRTLGAGGCDEVVVVLRPSDQEATERARALGARVAPSGDPLAEQIDSLRAGLRTCSRGVEAAVVLPVDHPRVKPATVSALVEAFRAHGAPIVVPTFEGERGHPVLFTARVFEEILRYRGPEGARGVINAHSDTREVPVDDRGVLIDVDTPADYGDEGEENEP